MSAAVESIAPTFLVAEARVRSAERITPAFVRVTLESPAFEKLGITGFDTRFKLVFPGPTGQLPDLPGQPDDWYADWMAMPDGVKSPMRTYTVRDVLEQDDTRLLVVDLVVHAHGPHGPACRWALSAQPGDAVHVMAPHRDSQEYGGIEFDPGSRGELLLIADETAVPALARILADLSPDYTGHAFVEVPSAEDILPLDVPDGIKVTWLTRRDSGHGRGLVDEVRRYLNLGALEGGLPITEVSSDLDVEVWETARYSSSGEDVDAPQPRADGTQLHNLYAWIAGESWMVKALRRSLVTELDVPRGQVAFMGYWREGVSMRS